MKQHTPLLGPIEQAAQNGLRAGSKAMLARARELAPRDDDDLVKSGGVRVDDLTAQVSFTAFHARFQHEDLDYEHPNGGQAKFLEQAAAEIAVEQYVADYIAEALGG